MPTKYKRKHKCEFCGKFLSGRSSFWNHIYVYKCRERVSWNKCDSCNWLLNINQQWISDINIIFQKKKKQLEKEKFITTTTTTTTTTKKKDTQISITPTKKQTKEVIIVRDVNFIDHLTFLNKYKNLIQSH